MFRHIEHNFKLPDIVDNTTEQGRTYAVPSGHVYPSITTVLSLNDVGWLAEWRANVGELKAKEISTTATIRGNAVHDMTENYLNNMDRKEVVINREPTHKFMFNQLRQKLKYINDIYAQEVGLFSDTLMTAGRVDCIGSYKEKPAIIDFKTATNPKSRDDISNYFKQGAAYSVMWRELTGISIDTIVILMCVKNSMAPLEFIEPVSNWVEPLKQDIAAFYKSDHGLVLK